jgi:hypothetical protein
MGRSTVQQAMSRGWSDDGVAKLGLPKNPPTYAASDDAFLGVEGGRQKKKTHRRPIREHDQQVKTHEDEVAKRMAAGHSRLIAEQQVLDAYGATVPRSNFGKVADTLTVRFMKRCDAIMMRDRCDRTEAMRTARSENEGEFNLFQLG